MYSFKNDIIYNDDFSVNSVVNVSYDVSDGNTYYNDSTVFSFQDQGNHVDNGYLSINYKLANSISFELYGASEPQTATLYMKAGVWSNENAEFLIVVGDVSEYITIPKGYKWYYLKINITFEDTVQVRINPMNNFSGYSLLSGSGSRS